MKTLNLIVTLTIICFLSPPVTGIQQNSGSQVLLARNADIILIGEVVYLGKSPYSREPSVMLRPSNVASENQTVVFQVRDTLKGGYKQPFIKIDVAFSVELLTMPTLTLKDETPYILLVKREETPTACEELKIKEYQQLPCYRISREAVIIATNEDVEAFKWLVNASNKN
jgi:hypothetical protein